MERAPGAEPPGPSYSDAGPAVRSIAQPASPSGGTSQPGATNAIPCGGDSVLPGLAPPEPGGPSPRLRVSFGILGQNVRPVRSLPFGLRGLRPP